MAEQVQRSEEAILGTAKAVAEMEEFVLQLLDEVAGDDELAPDHDWLCDGRRQIQLGFMAVKRAIHRPGRLPIPELDAPIVETGWVLEREDSSASAPIYYAPSAQSQWSVKDTDALRFAREIDASALAASIGVAVRVCEHAWES